jgi:hypothetical protein
VVVLAGQLYPAVHVHATGAAALPAHEKPMGHATPAADVEAEAQYDPAEAVHGKHDAADVDPDELA